MFDNIGKDLDEEATKRRATSLLLTTGCCALLGLLAGIATYSAVEAIQEAVDEPLVAMLEPPEEEPSALPAPPPPPPLRGTPSAEEDPKEPEATEPTDPQTLPPEVDDKIVSTTPPVGTSDGSDNGDPNGVAGGIPGGQPGSDGTSCGDGPCGPPVRVLHHSELEVRKRTDPAYPEAARALSMGTQRCLVRVFIDETGTPYEAFVEKCPKVFHEESRAAILKWRWYPPKDGKNKIKAQTTIAISYRLD